MALFVESCSRVALTHIKNVPRYHMSVLLFFYCHVSIAQTCWAPFALFRVQGGKNDVCAGVIVLVHLKAVFIFLTAKRANLFLLLFFFCVCVCAGAESNFLRFFPSFLSEKSEVICKLCPFNPHRPMQLFPLKILELWVERTRAHVLESERRWLFEE